jgi:N utilization substance protein B
MGARSSGRQAALQMLFAMEAGEHDAATAIADFWAEFPGDAEGRPYADELVLCIEQKRAGLDDALRDGVVKWRLERMAPVDRNILRLSLFELLHRPDVPFEVIIDEAVELAKLYGADQSPAFVNGVLDKLAKEHRTP